MEKVQNIMVSEPNITVLTGFNELCTLIMKIALSIKIEGPSKMK